MSSDYSATSSDFGDGVNHVFRNRDIPELSNTVPVKDSVAPAWTKFSATAKDIVTIKIC